MLLQSDTKTNARCSRGWLACVACGLLSLALLVAGLGTQTQVRADDKQPEPGKAADPNTEKPKLGGLQDLNKLFEQLEKLGNLDADQLKQMRKQMEQAQKQFERMQNLPGFPGMPGFGPNGGVMGFGFGNSPESRFGAMVSRPNKVLVDQLELPKDQGLVIENVIANKPAAKAGLKPSDILLEIDGKAVSSRPGAFGKQVAGLKAKTPVDVVVMRKGKKETIKGLELPEVTAAGMPNGFFPNPGGFGGFGGGLGGVGGTSTSVSVINGEVTIKHTEGDLKINIKGAANGGKTDVSEVTIENKDGKKTYDSLDKVPAEYLNKVKKLVSGVKAGGGAKKSDDY